MDLMILQQYVDSWLKMLQNFGEFKSENGFLTCHNERIDMLNEKF